MTCASSSSVPSDSSPLFGPRRQRDEADDVDRRVRGVAQRVADGLDVLAAADEHRAALVARRAQEPAGRLLVAEAQQRDVDDGEEQRAVEDVERGELVAAGDRVDERDERDLRQRGDDARHARPLAAGRVQARAGEQQHGQQAREVEQLVGRGRLRAQLPDAGQQARLQPQRCEDRHVDADRVEHEQRADAHDAAQRVEAQQEREDRRALAPDVALGQGEIRTKAPAPSPGYEPSRGFSVDRHPLL